jgi:hypothetical protein
MKLKFIVAGLLAAASFAASAADQTVTLNTSDIVSFTATSPVLAGGDDVISFNGLAAGVYDISITLSSQGVTWNQAATTLNGVTGVFSGSKLQFADFEYTGSAPFALTLVGTKTVGAKAFGYSADVSVAAAVPEPETYGMLLGGLAVLGFAARRKAKKAA